MNRHVAERRDARIAQLRARATLRPHQHDELRRLEDQFDSLWARLPAMIARQRRRLATMESYADAIGLGPC